MVAAISPSTRRASYIPSSASSPKRSPQRAPHSSRTHFIFRTKFDMLIVQKLAGPSNYARWSDNMRVILQANDLWDALAPGLLPIAESPTDHDAQVATQADALMSKRTFLVIFSSCTWPMQQELNRCFDGPSAWAILRDYAAYLRRDPHVALNLGHHRVEFSFGGFHW